MPSQDTKQSVWTTFLLGLSVVVVLFCGGIGFWLFSAIAPAMWMAGEILEDTADSHDTVLAFLEHVRTDRLDDAYALTSESFREQTSFQDFEVLMRQHGLHQFESPHEDQLTFYVVDLGTRVFSYPLGEKKGIPRFLELEVIKDGTAIRINTFKVVRQAEELEGDAQNKHTDARDLAADTVANS